MGSRVSTRIAMYILLSLSFVFIYTPRTSAEEILDWDGDGLYDYEELFRYFTSPSTTDTDGDGFSDGQEVQTGYSPLFGDNKKMSEVDSDGDGLNDELEIRLGTRLNIFDTDGDNIGDGDEVYSGYDPLSADPDRTAQKKSVVRHVEVDLSTQQMRYFLNNVEVGAVPVATGKRGTPTPKGEFTVFRKLPVHRYVGEDYDLPNVKWNLEFKRGYYLHGAYWHNQFGIRPMSHGCVNISTANAEKIYKFLDIGDKVKVDGITPIGRVAKQAQLAKPKPLLTASP